MHFLTYTGLYNTFRLGVLRTILDRPFHPKSPDMQEYIELYHKYLKFKNKDKLTKAEELVIKLTSIENNYRTDFI